VRKALLQAQAEIERIELAQRVGDVRAALSPKNLVQRLVSTGGSARDGLFQRLSGQLTSHPGLLSGAAFLLGKGRARRIVKVITAVLALRKALQLMRR